MSIRVWVSSSINTLQAKSKAHTDNSCSIHIKVQIPEIYSFISGKVFAGNRYPNIHEMSPIYRRPGIFQVTGIQMFLKSLLSTGVQVFQGNRYPYMESTNLQVFSY